MPPNSSPISDLNSHGQVVGTNMFYDVYPSIHLTLGTYAAFTDVNGQPHDFSLSYTDDPNSANTDNLNNYIIPIPGVYLTSAVKIDDLGRIIAVGSNGDDYLLTPLALGPPSPTPEPSTFALLAVASAGFAIRRRSGRW